MCFLANQEQNPNLKPHQPTQLQFDSTGVDYELFSDSLRNNKLCKNFAFTGS